MRRFIRVCAEAHYERMCATKFSDMRITILSLMTLLVMSMLPQLSLAKGDDKKDVVVFSVDGRNSTRSEFEYFYNKNAQLDGLQDKTFDEYVEFFINYRLKVAEGYVQGVDTTQSYINELAGYRQQLAEPYLSYPGWGDTLVQQAYDRLKLEVKASHLLLMCDEKTPASVADSLYDVVLGYQREVENGASFDSLARNFSQDPSARMNAGDLGYFSSLQMVYPFEQAAYNTPVGKTSVVRSNFGWHLIKVFDRRDNERLKNVDIDQLRDSVRDESLKRQLLKDADRMKEGQLRFAASKRDELMQDKKLRKKLSSLSDEELLKWLDEHLEEQEPDFRNIYREYYDGLMLFEVSNAAVWDKAQKDTLGQQSYFEQHRADYVYTHPKFKGAFIECVDDSLLFNALKQIYDNNDALEAAEIVRQTILTDSILTPNPKSPRFHIINGIFSQGDNALVDVERFKTEGASFTAREEMPRAVTYGRVLQAPETISDVRGAVIADYQDKLEQEWVSELRKKFKVEIKKKELEKLRQSLVLQK